MTKDNVFLIGKVDERIYKFLPVLRKYSSVYQSDGLIKHIQKRHPDCVKYLSELPSIISSPDYIGVNPNESGTSFELVKIFDDNMQVGIKLDAKNDYLYVATLHAITDAKLSHRIASNRLKPVT